MKKGFTLIELLAVIAILAILIVIAVPSVMGLFDKASQNSFLTEAKNVFKTASTQTVKNDMLSEKENQYCKSSSETENILDMKSKENLYYNIVYNNDGSINHFHISDSKYSITLDMSRVELNSITQIDDSYRPVSNCILPD